ncbi:mitochondrial Rho GTPase isoform X1 [Neocloeon triangulifer]|uniref:mitochondrial Rho GTPase isoform X1 n=1 Tax=Neocloeon triangulifer TaxID=2078957 RepID=UPI00286FA3CC|nr:mitochondrial Rho GTPase isoform X1 [Neocloeon triangulifer]
MEKYGQRQNVRILLLGDRGVGKTSLILSLVSEEFAEDVPYKAEEITIPPDVTPEHIPTNIVDYSAAEQSEEQLIEEVNKADVICVVYSVEDDESLEQVRVHWLPLLRHCQPRTTRPVILVGNKADLIEYSTLQTSSPFMEDFPEIEAWLECSARSLFNISEMFYHAQKAVLHPVGPLYSLEDQELTFACEEALIRIFKICDLDNDDLLSDREFNAFQMHCFNEPLDPNTINGLKSIIDSSISNGLKYNSITKSGFLFLHCTFIRRGRSETTWTVLRKFGYDDSLELSDNYLFPKIRISTGASTELSLRGQHFLSTLFVKHDKDHDGALNPDELQDLFSTCPRQAWDGLAQQGVKNTPQGWITMQGFMSQWALITLLSVNTTLEYLAYFGYPYLEQESQSNAISVTRERQLDWLKKQSSRTVYECAVIGPKGCGKTAFCRSMLGHSLSDTNHPPCLSTPSWYACTLQVYGQDKVLVLRDVDLESTSTPLTATDLRGDVTCLTYNHSDPSSFEYVARIFLKYFVDCKEPVLIVACKSDLPRAKQDYLLQPAAFCQKHRLPPPHLFTAMDHDVEKEIYLKLATMAAFPRFQAAWVLFYKTRHLRDLKLLREITASWWKTSITLAIAAALGLFLMRCLKPHNG